MRGVYLLRFNDIHDRKVVHKVGRSIDVEDRMRDYKEPTKVAFYETDYEEELERVLITKFEEKGFEVVHGREWFVGNEASMKSMVYYWGDQVEQTHANDWCIIV